MLWTRGRTRERRTESGLDSKTQRCVVGNVFSYADLLVISTWHLVVLQGTECYLFNPYLITMVEIISAVGFDFKGFSHIHWSDIYTISA